MTDPGAESPELRWAARDWLAAAGLFAATAGVILWQNAHVAVLWDISYVLDSAVRIAVGQTPYRDFPFAHAPLTFLIQAAIIRLTGRVFFHHVIYVAAVGGVSTVLAWRIVLHTLRGRVERAWVVALVLAAPLTVLGIYCIFPFPSYDCDCGFSILVAAWLWQRVSLGSEDSGAGRAMAFAAGAALCLPLFFKQNIGLPFLAAGVVAVLSLLGAGLIKRSRMLAHKADAGLASSGAAEGLTSGAKAQMNEAEIDVGVKTPTYRFRFRIGEARLMAWLAGVGVTLLVAVVLIHFTAGIGNYLYWTIGFAAQRRLPGMQAMLAVYEDPSLMWELPCVAAGLLILRSRLGQKRWAHWAALVLLAAPFLFVLASLLMYDDADERGDSLLALWPLLLILAGALAVFRLVRNWRVEGLRALLPVLLLVAINGTLMSQQLWGSTYAIWPLLVVLIAEMIAWLARLRPEGVPGSGSLQAAGPALAGAKAQTCFQPDSARLKSCPVTEPSSSFGESRRFGFGFAMPGMRMDLVLTGVIAVTLLVCGGFYTASEERLSYAQLPDGPVVHASVPELAGMAVAGTTLPDFEELLRYAAAQIPVTDGLVLIPGEDPFYFATGRVPQFPVLLFDPSTDPYSPVQVVEEVKRRQIHWLIVKRELQIKEDPTPRREETLRLLMSEFSLAARLRAYDVYRR